MVENTVMLKKLFYSKWPLFQAYLVIFFPISNDK